MSAFSGVICPILTPFEADGRIARDLWLSHAKWVLDQGAHYLSPFGTTGEATSVGMATRMQALEWLIEGGIPADRLMPGTGLPALADTAELCAHAGSAGCPAVMVLPSFFYKDAPEAGQARYFAELIDAVGDDAMRVILYNIPQNSGVWIRPSLVARLKHDFPDQIAAYKDSSGDWDNTEGVIGAAPGVAVFPGSEGFLTKGLSHGAAGSISASVNLNAGAIRAVYDGARAGQNVASADAEMQRVRSCIQRAGLIPAMKAALAVRSGDDRWLNLRPPFANATAESGQALLDALGSAADHLGAAA